MSHSAADTFQPAVWLLEPDGVSLAAFSAGQGEVLGSNFASVLVADPGTWYVRVMDFATGGGVDYTFDLDITTDVLDSAVTSIPEVESNDESPFQPLGPLTYGLWEISGSSATAGYTTVGQDVMWTGDLDVFTFQVDADRQVEFELDWDGVTSDLDLLLYDNSGPTGDVGVFPSDDLVSSGAASLDQPETDSVQLAGGKEYALMVANFEGDPDVPWTLQVRVLGGP